MKNLYKAILTALKDETVFTDAGLDPLKLIDIYRHQPDEPAKFEVYDTPAVFVDWNIKYDDSANSGKYNQGTINVDFHLVLDDLGDTSSLAGQADLDKGLRMFDYINVVQQQIDGLSGGHVSKLYRSSEATDTIDVNTYHIMSYTGRYNEDNTGDIYDYIEDTEIIVHKTGLKTHIC